MSTPVRGKLPAALSLADRLEEVLQFHVDILIEESLPVYLHYLVDEAVSYQNL